MKVPVEKKNGMTYSAECKFNVPFLKMTFLKNDKSANLFRPVLFHVLLEILPDDGPRTWAAHRFTKSLL